MTFPGNRVSNTGKGDFSTSWEGSERSTTAVGGRADTFADSTFN